MKFIIIYSLTMSKIESDVLGIQNFDDITAVCLFVCCLLNVQATCYCITGTDLLRRVYVLPH